MNCEDYLDILPKCNIQVHKQGAAMRKVFIRIGCDNNHCIKQQDDSTIPCEYLVYGNELNSCIIFREKLEADMEAPHHPVRCNECKERQTRKDDIVGLELEIEADDKYCVDTYKSNDSFLGVHFATCRHSSNRAGCAYCHLFKEEIYNSPEMYGSIPTMRSRRCIDSTIPYDADSPALTIVVKTKIDSDGVYCSSIRADGTRKLCRQILATKPYALWCPVFRKDLCKDLRRLPDIGLLCRLPECISADKTHE